MDITRFYLKRWLISKLLLDWKPLEQKTRYPSQCFLVRADNLSKQVINSMKTAEQLPATIYPPQQYGNASNFIVSLCSGALSQLNLIIAVQRLGKGNFAK